MSNKALEADLKGLRLLVERRGKFFALAELISNAWDEDGVTKVDVEITHEGRNLVALSVTDDAPQGFQDLTHAYTLFAPSKKKDCELKRGRFNMGEKLVIGLSDTFEVASTSGGVRIDVRENRRSQIRKKRERGSQVSALIRMTKVEMEEAITAFHTLIPPTHIVTTINGVRLATRQSIASFTATLQTEKADAEGFLRPSRRNTLVEVYEPLPGETPSLYEMGIPVVATDDAYHVNITQKVPLNSDRDNVPPAFLRDVRALVLNNRAKYLTAEQSSESWVSEALEDELVSRDAVESVLVKRFGEKRVVYDPSDAEANRIAQSTGYTVIPSNAFSKAAWTAVRNSGAVLPAGRVTPSPKPFGPDGAPVSPIAPSLHTPAQAQFVRAVARLHKDLVGTGIRVELTDVPTWPFYAVYGGGRTMFNMALLKPEIRDEQTLATVIHEFGHFYGAHLTHAFDDAMGRIAARLVSRVTLNPNYLAECEAA